MAADQERADRVREIKRDNPGLRWKHIAEYVGVELRSAQMWQETGAISYENAKKLAELVDVSVDWIMRGTPASSPTPFAGPDAAAELQDTLSDVLQEIKDQLARQTQVLEEIKGYAAAAKTMLEEQKAVKTETEEATARLLAAAETARLALRPATQSPEAAPGTPAK